MGSARRVLKPGLVGLATAHAQQMSIVWAVSRSARKTVNLRKIARGCRLLRRKGEGFLALQRSLAVLVKVAALEILTVPVPGRSARTSVKRPPTALGQRVWLTRVEGLHVPTQSLAVQAKTCALQTLTASALGRSVQKSAS